MPFVRLSKIADVRFIALGLQKGVHGYHIGILQCRPDSEERSFVHLAFHYRLLEEPPSNGFLYFQPAISDRRARIAASMCRRVTRANAKGIPYGFSFYADSIDPESGVFRASTSNIGLTCATFVLAVFSSVAIEILDSTTWPRRDEDTIWQENILKLLCEHAGPEHAVLASKQIGDCRFKPQEVVGGAVANSHPAPYHAVEPIRDEIERLFY